MGAVRRFCDRAVLLERGEVLDIGDPDAVSAKYQEINFGRVEEDGLADGAGLPRVQIARAWIQPEAKADETRPDRAEVSTGASCETCMEVEFLDAIEDPVFSMTFRNEVRHTIFVARSDAAGSPGPTGRFAAGDRAVVRFRFPNWLAHSTYTLTPAVLTGDMRVVLDQHIDAATLVVETGRHTGGVVDIPTEMDVRRP
jgi:hypothetical protein